MVTFFLSWRLSQQGCVQGCNWSWGYKRERNWVGRKPLYRHQAKGMFHKHLCYSLIQWIIKQKQTLKNETNAAFISLKVKLMKHKKLSTYTMSRWKSSLNQEAKYYTQKRKKPYLMTIRSKCMKSVKMNFTKIYRNRLLYPLQLKLIFNNYSTEKQAHRRNGKEHVKLTITINTQQKS